MALCGVVTVLLTAVTLRGLRASQRRTVGALALVATFPLLLGSVVLTRFDLYPTALVAGALAALVHRRDRLGFVLLGAAVAVKLFPAVLVPVALGYVWRRRGRREARRLSRALCRGGRARLPPVPRRRARRRRAQPRAAAVAAAPDREPRLRALPGRPSPRRARRRDAVRPRLAEPLCDGNRSDGGRAQPRPDRSARLDLAAAAGDERGARSLGRRRPRRLRRAREGAVAAVPDLARAGRSARRRHPRAARVGAARGGARADSALVPVALLGPRARARPACPRRSSCSATSSSSRCSIVLVRDRRESVRSP